MMADAEQTAPVEETEVKEPRLTRNVAIEKLRALGYTGPVSYTAAKVKDILAQVEAGTYTGKGAPGSDDTADDEGDDIDE